MKHGRGFSFAEIREAGLTPAFAQSVGISVDHRRHNKNAEYQAANVALLNRYKSKLLLFPRHAGVAKKGVIADSTAEQLKGEGAQNTTDGVFALPSTTRRCKTAALTKDILGFRAYHTLRLARVNKRYAGIRAKKAKEAEEKKK